MTGVNGRGPRTAAAKRKPNPLVLIVVVAFVVALALVISFGLYVGALALTLNVVGGFGLSFAKLAGLALLFEFLAIDRSLSFRQALKQAA